MSRPEARRPAWWPSPREEVLLRLALGRAVEPHDAVAALAAAAEAPSADEARLLPVLHHRLDIDTAHPLLDLPPATAGRLRRAWAESRSLRLLAVRQAAEVLDLLAAEGIVAAPLKGLAMEMWFGPPGRPVGDLDLWLPEAALPAALARLRAAGYEPRDEADPDAPRAKHSCALGRADGAEVDLHWLLDVRLALAPGRSGREAAMERFRRAAAPAAWQGRAVLRLCDEHHLLLAALHGARVDSRAEVRWMVDAAAILARAGGGFDWDEVLAAARAARLERWLAAPLAALATLLPGAVPTDVVRRAAAAPAAAADRLLAALDRGAAPAGILRDLQRTLRWHLARSRHLGLVGGLLAYPRHLREAGLLGGPRRLAAHLRRRRREARERRLAYARGRQFEE